MRAFEIISEAKITVGDFATRNAKYWTSIIALVRAGTPIRTGETGEVSVTVANGVETADQLQNIWDGSSNASAEQINNIKKLVLKTDGPDIKISNIYKSADIKGKDSDYNIGDIGEIALGIAVATRFLGLGKVITTDDFVSVGSRLKISSVKGKESMSGILNETIRHTTGKTDNVILRTLAPSRSMNSLPAFLSNFTNAPKDVQGTILSAIKYANDAEKIQTGIEQTAADENANSIEILADGVSDQRGTKADLIMTIDGESINLISAKASKSQLGQASGHDFNNPKTFFSSVFGIDISQYQKEFGKTNEEHISTLRKVYANHVIPKVLKLTGGDSVVKEAELVRSIAYGLIRYSNNVKDTGEIEVVDIVKLVTNPGSAGYDLLRIDERLYDALNKVDLRGAATKNNLGVKVTGIVDNQELLLFKARSYFSPAGKTVRTIIEGGPLLDKLALATPTVK